MALKPAKRVLVVEDEPAWQRLIRDLVQEVAHLVGRTVEMEVVASFADATDKIEGVFYDCITVDNKLVDGKRAKVLLDRIGRSAQQIPTLVLSGDVNPREVRDFFKEYEIEEFFWKDDFDRDRFRKTLAGLLALGEEGGESQGLQPELQGVRYMDWNTVTSLAVSALSPYATALASSAVAAAGKKLGEAVSERISELWQWVRQAIDGSDDESAKQVWESFEQDPQGNRDALIDTIRQLRPEGDAVLQGYVQGLLREIQRRKDSQLVSLLDNPDYYRLSDVERISNRVSTQWESDLGSNPPQHRLARWAVDYARTRNLQQDLIAAMLEVNPTVMLQ